MYNSSRQYRCTIIRGKSQKEIDTLLPIYANVIDEICPCPHDDFEFMFNQSIESKLPESQRIKKTIDNHRTEISGKLFGMYYFSNDGLVYESERTKKYLKDKSIVEFFIDICDTLQFPNGMQKTLPTVKQRVDDKIFCRPISFVLKTLELAEKERLYLTKKDIGYYILNSYDVLSGVATPYEVVDTIKEDKNNGIKRIITVPGKASSYCYQHINEQIKYMELANLVYIENERVKINTLNISSIKIGEKWDVKPGFDVYKYCLDEADGRRKFQMDWDEYYSHVSDLFK